MTTQNQALSDELEAVNSIYDAQTCTVTSFDVSTGATSTILTLPDLAFSFLIDFPSDYPDVPPAIISTQSTGASTRIGQGDAAANILRGVLGNIFLPGQVCLFDLVEESGSLLKHDDKDSDMDRNTQGDVNDTTHSQPESVKISENLSTVHVPSPPTSRFKDASSMKPTDAISSAPNWTLSEPLIVNKSTFVARALAVSSLDEATESISHLLTNKRIASATHNITAWRIKSEPPSTNNPDKRNQRREIIIQDCDDDGETAAGGRLLHLMQLMDVWNVVVVVTRWYGGVKLGSDRFRCINNVAREALVNGGFGAADHEAKSGIAKGKARKK